VDGLDVEPYRARGHVEQLTELRDGKLSIKESQHFQLALRKLPVHRRSPARPGLSEFALLALEQFEKYARVRIQLHARRASLGNSPRGDHPMGEANVSAKGEDFCMRRRTLRRKGTRGLRLSAGPESSSAKEDRRS